MPKLKPDNIRKLYYTIPELTQLVGITKLTLLRWVKLYGIVPARGGERCKWLFAEDDIVKFQLIHFLRFQKGLTPNGVTTYLAMYGWASWVQLEEMKDDFSFLFQKAKLA